MTYRNTRRGFTLIELLVVVLIIGILAAVAVPQYQKAVTKSRATEALVTLKAVSLAQEAHYLGHGAYATTAPQLDIELPELKNSALYLYTDRGTEAEKIQVGLNKPRVAFNYLLKYKRTECTCDSESEDCWLCKSFPTTKADCVGIDKDDEQECYYFN